MIQRLQHWLRFNLMYFRSPPWDTGISPPELLEFIQTHSPRKALDLGCGTGTNLVTLARAGWQVVGIDFAVKAVQSAKKKLQRTGLSGRVIQGDVTRIQLPEAPFDLILDIGCFHGLPASSRPAYLANLIQNLAVQGTFLIYVHLINESHSFGVTPEDIQAFHQGLRLRSRRDSLDRFGRAAAWLEFERPFTPEDVHVA